MTVIDRECVKRSFNASAATYDRHASLQEELGGSLLGLVGGESAAVSRVLDIGMGTGNLTRLLRTAFPAAQVFGCDIAENMISRARAKLAPAPLLFAAADAEHLPFSDSAFDLVASGFTFQWLEEWTGALNEVMRVLRPGGQFIFSAFGGRTFWELRQAFTDACRATGYDAGQALSLPLTEERLLFDLSDAGFSQPAVISSCRVVPYPSVSELVRAIKGMGARNASTHRSRSPAVRRAWRCMVGLYGDRHACPEGIPATYEIIMGSARRAPSTAQELR